MNESAKMSDIDPMPSSSQSAFHLSSVQFATTLRAWAYLVVVMTLCRMVWYFELADRVPETALMTEWLAAFVHGCRQDISASGYLLAPTIVLGMLVCLLPRMDRATTVMRAVCMTLALALTPLLFYCSVGYYEAYNDVFGTMLFELFTGNVRLVAGEAASNHRLFERLCYAAIGAALVLYGYRVVCRRIGVNRLVRLLDGRSSGRRLATALVVPLFVVIAIRSSVISRPLQKIDSSVTDCIVLNRGAINPYIALRYAIGDQLESLKHQNKGYDSNETAMLLSRWQDQMGQAESIKPTSPSQTTLVSASSLGLDLPVFQRTSQGPPNVEPSHVFLLFMESYDSWPMLAQFADWNIVDDGKALAKEGLWLKAFLPAANSSVVSYIACLQGMQGTNRFSVQNLPTGLIHNLNQLNFQTREINGCPADWGGVREASERLGFDEIYCVEDIMPGGETSNHWVHDRTLFEFAKQLPYTQRTFTSIRSCSNHGPWEVDLQTEQCEVQPLPEKVDGHPLADESRRRVYGHARYADRMMVQFIRDMSQRFPDALFVITGDHYGRNYPTHFPNIYQRSSVPLILYGPKVLQGLTFPSDAVGSHVDIAPTLIELCAPAGFHYHSLGKNLFDPKAAKHGVGTGFVMFPNCIVSVTEPAAVEPLPWTPATEPLPPNALSDAKQLHQLYHGLGYHLSSKPNAQTRRH